MLVHIISELSSFILQICSFYEYLESAVLSGINILFLGEIKCEALKEGRLTGFKIHTTIMFNIYALFF